MPLSAFANTSLAVGLLRRSLEQGRLGHAYLLAGDQTGVLEGLAREFAKTLNCLAPVRAADSGPAVDCCDACDACARGARDAHPDVHWIRPESKTRIIRIEQVRDLIETLSLKPAVGAYKVGLIVDADRMNVQSANAFLKTLEEPPARSILVLLSSEPERLLETIRSRCLRLFLAGQQALEPATREWVREFAEQTQQTSGALLARYKLLGGLLDRLGVIRGEVEQALRAPLEQMEELDPKMRDRIEDETTAAVEAEYRRRRAELLRGLSLWLRDVWICGVGAAEGLLYLPELTAVSRQLAERLGLEALTHNFEVVEQMQAVLHSNVQEALALEVGLLKLRL